MKIVLSIIVSQHASNSISHGSIPKMALIFQVLFCIPLHDVHHAFHKMKIRSGFRTIFLDQLKTSLKEYMDKGRDYNNVSSK